MRHGGSAQYMGEANQDLRAENSRLAIDNQLVRGQRRNAFIAGFLLCLALTYGVPWLYAMVSAG